jgi:hypothetical protein
MMGGGDEGWKGGICVNIMPLVVSFLLAWYCLLLG